MTSLTLETLRLYGLWIQSGAIVFSAIGVIVTVNRNKRIACRRATLDIVLKEQTDPEIVAQRTDFVKLRDAGHLSKWAGPDQTHSDEASVIRSILNRYELVAIGIKEGTIDEQSYKRWCRTTLVKDWIECKALVVQLRKNASIATYYIELEKLAKRWATKNERKHT